MTSALRRVYGGVWNDAPQPLRRAAAVIVAAAVASLALSVPVAIAAASSLGGTIALLLFFLVVHLVIVGLAVFLLRRSRLAWLLLVTLAIAAAARLPESLADIAFYGVNALTLVLLLTPGAARAVWSGYESPYVATPDVQRPD